MPGLEDDVWRQLMRIEALEGRMAETARRLTALEERCVSPSSAPASESTCTTCNGSREVLWKSAYPDNEYRECPDCEPTKTGETPPTGPATGPDPRMIPTGTSEDLIEALCNDLLSLRRFDHLMPEIVAVVRAAEEWRKWADECGYEYTHAASRRVRETLDALRAKLREVRDA